MPGQNRERLQSLKKHLESVVLGKSEEVGLALTCLVARGHLLLEDIPGVGKTTLAEGLARTFGLSFARVQFTSDLLPADILGGQVFLQTQGRFEMKLGPIFHQLVLADELNRAPPRTQSALLEAMAQTQVTLDGTTHELPKPFAVVATQNPVDLAGTYPLPDSQLDRFLMRLSLGRMTPDLETRLLVERRGDPLLNFAAISTPEELIELQQAADAVTVADDLAEYAVRLANATREHLEIERGLSTRAVLSLMAAARARALWEDRDFVTPADVRSVFVPCLSHRILLKSSVQGTFARDEAAHLLSELLRRVSPPR
jgi:MoxR-like ATPase